ncbi:MAG: xanthine phosphoribosyltransferase [Firmicutes bacterium]|nr:xanthine phosphoribosyltransferase [Bacillota bacterium]
MKVLKDKILIEGKVLSDTVLKVDSFLNHQIDPAFAMDLGKELAARFKNQSITKILTVEASGIAVAMATGLALNIPVVFAKKKRAATADPNVFSSTVYSFTKDESVDIYVNSRFLHPSDNVLLVDDFLAQGEALRGMVEIVQQSGASLAGAGIIIEKVFQGGGKALREAGVRIETLAPIASLAGGKITFC